MPEGFGIEGERGLSVDQQEELTKRLIDSVDAEQASVAGHCPFTPEQLDFLAMVFRDILITIGQSPLVLVGYSPVNEAYIKWNAGVRVDK